MNKEIKQESEYFEVMKAAVEAHIGEGITFEEGFALARENFHKIAYTFIRIDKPNFENFLTHCIRVEINQSLRRFRMKGV